MPQYDEVDLEDMDYDTEARVYTYQCPCGDLFHIALEDLHEGEENAYCPSCTLWLLVQYDPDELPALEA